MPGATRPTAGARRESRLDGHKDAQTRAAAKDGAVGRAIRVLAEIGRGDGLQPPSLSDLARSTQLPKSTVHRLLGVLESLGAIERNVLGYRLSKEMWLAGNATRDDMLRHLVMPHLVDLYLQVHEATSLGVLRGDRVVYLETIFQNRHKRFVHLVGPSGPAHATAAGKVLLAYRPAIAARYGIDLPLPPFTQRTITTPGRFHAELAHIRAEGIAFSLEEHQRGVVDAAVPVIDLQGEPVAAIAVGGPLCHLDIGAVVPQLRVTAGTASAALSATGLYGRDRLVTTLRTMDRLSHTAHENESG